ncbi:MAG: helix-turn-helix domain-containing protein [Pseudonocardiaceae bacterium]
MPAEENKQLRAARERTASLTYPDVCLSREELAELANAWIWDHHEKLVALSANYIGQLERGKIRWPGKLYREALREILGVSTDAALGFVNSRRAVVRLKDVDRKQFLRSGLGVGVGALVLGPVAALFEDSEPTPIPHRIGATEIEQVRVATRVFNSWSRIYGPGLAREAVMGQLRWSAALLEASCPDRLRPELFSAVGDLAETAGYAVQETGKARRVFRFALACAERAKDWPLRAEILSSMSKQAIWAGQPDDGLTLADQALVRADRLTPTGRAILHTDRARALVKMRRVNEALTSIGTADDHFARSTPDNDPPYMAYYDAARHAQCTGQPLVDLAILGNDPSEATDRLTAAAAGHTDTGNTVSRAICLANLASLTMVTGDPIQAAAIGHAALDIAGTIRSRRAAEELRELARYASPHRHLDEVAHLSRRIGALLRCTDSGL